jgi:hypothetical protein
MQEAFIDDSAAIDRRRMLVNAKGNRGISTLRRVL